MFNTRSLRISFLSRTSLQQTWLTNWIDSYGINIKPREDNVLSSYMRGKHCTSNYSFEHRRSSPASYRSLNADKNIVLSREMYKSSHNTNQFTRVNRDREYDERNQRSKKLDLARIVIALSLLGFFRTDKPDVEEQKSSEDKRKSVLKPRQSYADKQNDAKRKKGPFLPRSPADSSEIPKHVPYLIIGGGTASYAAFQTILKNDPSAKILVISSEPYYPYKKPPLSKEMWFQKRPSPSQPHVFKLVNGKEKSLFYRSAESYKQCRELMREEGGGVAVARGWRVKKIEVTSRTVLLDDGFSVGYEKCLIATGCSPKVLKFLSSESTYVSERVSSFCDFSDYQRVDNVLRSGNKSVVIIGGGILGSELACSLSFRGRKNRVDVTQIYSESGNLRKILPEHLSNWTTAKLRREGIKMYPNCAVKSVSAENGLTLHLNTGEDVYADHVILAIGGVPNTQFAQSSKLEIDHESGGFVVNAELMARSNVWVAGDCCSFFDSKIGRTRLERYDHAVATGRLAAENMTGGGKSYQYQSMFWSDLGPKFGFEAIGLIDARLPTVSVFTYPKNAMQSIDLDNSNSVEIGNAKHEDFSKGIVFYLENEVIVGILLWNVYGQLPVARQIVSEKRREDELDDVLKRFSFAQDVPFSHLDGSMYMM